MAERHREEQIEMERLADRLSAYLRNGGALSDEKREALLAAIKLSDLSKHVAKVPRPIAPQTATLPSERPRAELRQRVFNEMKEFMESTRGRPEYKTIPSRDEHDAAKRISIGYIDEYLSRLPIERLSKAIDFVCDFHTYPFYGAQSFEDPDPEIKHFRNRLRDELLRRDPKEEEMKYYYRLVHDLGTSHLSSKSDQAMNFELNEGQAKNLRRHLPKLKDRLRKAF